MVIDDDWFLDMYFPPEPYRSGNLTPEQADDWRMLTGWDSQRPYYSSDGIDSGDARRLLAAIPDSLLSYRWNFSPTVGAILRSIAKHPQVRANCRAPDQIPDADDFRPISGILIDDPELLTFTPDIELGPLPAWIADLDLELRREYYHHRAACIRNSIFRQHWHAARHRYDLHDAESPPDEIDIVTGLRGQSVLHLWWD